MVAVMKIRGSLRSVMVNELDYDIVVNEFELQSRCDVNFLANPLGKDMNRFTRTKYGLYNNTNNKNLSTTAQFGHRM